MDIIYERFRNLNLDFSVIGIEQRSNYIPYYCTPENAQIIGSAGVDGIHYCTIPEFGEMIFAVSPMNFGDCVHPIAYNFEDLLRLLLYCSDMAALEQCCTWDEEQFKAFLIDCPPTEEQQIVLDAIQQEFGLEPMKDAFSYIKELQSEFDLSKIPYTEDYYDPDMNVAAPIPPTDWKVTYDGGFWNSEGNAGTEIVIDKAFCWGNEKWYIPSVYLCDKGLVVDYFMEAELTQVKAFIDKWDLYNENDHCFTKEQREQINRENPLDISFHGHITYNGKNLQSDHSCGLTWFPECCLPQGTHPESDAVRVLEHYGLDKERAWSIHRSSYRLDNTNGLNIQALSVRMERKHERFTGQHFITPAVGESISLHHPLYDRTYILTVHEIEQQELSENSLRDPFMEYPTHTTVMTYSLEPDISEQSFMLKDCSDNDSPRLKKPDSNSCAPNASNAVTIGIIGGSDGPTVMFITGKSGPKLHAACSSLHFEPVNTVEWRTIFSEKTIDDITVSLI